MTWFIGIVSGLASIGSFYKAVTAATPEQAAAWTHSATATAGVAVMAGVSLARSASRDQQGA